MTFYLSRGVHSPIRTRPRPDTSCVMPDTLGIKKPMVVNVVFAVYGPLLQLYEIVLCDSSTCQPFQISIEQWNEVDYQMTTQEVPCVPLQDVVGSNRVEDGIPFSEKEMMAASSLQPVG